MFSKLYLKFTLHTKDMLSGRELALYAEAPVSIASTENKIKKTLTLPTGVMKDEHV
jgi:hypothetical protein